MRRRCPTLALVAGAAFLLTTSPAGAQAPQRGLEGTVRVTGAVEEAGSRIPVFAAEVTVAGTKIRALTDEDGRFVLGAVPAGAALLRVSRPGYQEASIRLEPAEGVHVTILLEPGPVPLAGMVVAPGHFGLGAERVTGVRALTGERIRAAPQLGDDVFRAVSRIPGVTTSDFSAAFGIRGSRPEDVLVMLDGFELYEPFHLKDFDNAVSIVDVAVVDGVELMTGGVAAQYADRLGGAFDLRSAGVPPGRSRTQLGASVTALRAGSRGSFADDRGRWLVSARRGYLELALKLTGARERVAPAFWDLLGKVEYEAGRQTLSAHVLHASDALAYEEDDHDPWLASAYESSYAWLGWRGALGRTLSQHTTLGVGRLAWSRHGGTGPGRVALAMSAADERAFQLVSLRQDWTLEWAEHSLTRFGYHAVLQQAHYDYEGWRRLPLVLDGHLLQRTDSSRIRLSPRGVAADAWLVQRMRLSSSLVAEGGVRWGRRGHTGESHWTPRLDVAFSPGARTTLRGSWSQRAQPHAIHELAVQDGEDRFEPAERAQQWVGGIEHRLPSGVGVRAEAYDRRLRRLRPRWVNLDDADDLFPEAATARLLTRPEGGRSRGLELSAAREVTTGWSWSASWALSRATDRLDGRDVPRSRDQRHALGFDALWASREKWRFGFAWQYRSGWPRTPAGFVVDTLADGRRHVRRTHEEYNSARLAPYHRLDVRVSRHVPVGRGGVTIFLDVFNVYDRPNHRARIPLAWLDSRGRVRTGERLDLLLPRLPSLGVVWEF